MIGRTIATTIAAISLIAVALLAGSGNVSTMPVLAASNTVTFDDLAAGTAISNQYDSQGVDFQTGIIGSNVYCYPVVTQVPSSQAQSGDQVADTSCASGEFPDSSIHGTLKNATQTISVYAGHFSDPNSKGQSQQITLDAYDAGGGLLGSQTQTVMEGEGFHTLLHVEAGSASIVAFDVTSSYPHMGIDELTFTTPAPSGCAHVSTFTQLSDALNAGYLCVYVDDNARIDFTQAEEDMGQTNWGHGSILQVPNNVTIESGRSPTVPGGLLYETHNYPHYEKDMLELGSNDHITGLRLQGYDQTDTKARNGHDDVGIGIHGVDGELIDNNEIDGWPAAGIEVMDTPNFSARSQPPQTDEEYLNEADQIRISENFIHNNVQCGLGYGVAVGGTGYALIDRNLFDFDRHDVTSDGSLDASGKTADPHGYIAELNFILKPGPTCGGHYNQHFDQHGSDKSNDWVGGWAGQYNKIWDNTIRGAQHYGNFGYYERPAFDLRGTPSDSDTFAGNAVTQGGNYAVKVEGPWAAQLVSKGKLHIYGNKYDFNTANDLAAGNFANDGCSDVFQANGTAWWYSPCGSRDWRFLKADTHTLNQLALGDFNGDGKTDVFTQDGDRWLVSDGGTGPFTQLPAGSNIPMKNYRFGDFNGDGKTDIFRTNGHQWYYSAGGATAWIPLQTSSLKIDQLRLGDFDGNGETDVFSLANHQWSVSYGGVTAGQHLNTQISSNLGELVFADFNGDGKTDIARSHNGKWQVSWGGATPWVPLQTGSEPPITQMLFGDFSGGHHADVLQYRGLERYKLSTGGAVPIFTWSQQDMY